MFSRFYEEELAFLRQMGPEYARAHPGGIADALERPGTDPDVERLLEGFAFLAARVRERIEDDFPEVVHSLLGLLWPHLLRPVPSSAVVTLTPAAGALREVRRVPAGAEIQSVPVKGTRCRFRTSQDVDLAPLTLATARLEGGPGASPTIRLGFRLDKGVAFDTIDLRRLRLFLAEGGTAMKLFDSLSRDLVRAELRAPGAPGAPAGAGTAVKGIDLGPGAVSFPGFDPACSLLPDPPRSFSGFRLLQEYFIIPEKFLFVDVSGLERGRGRGFQEEFEIALVLSRLPEGLQRVDAANFRMFAAPAVNLFEHEARPFRIARERSEYLVVPDTDDPEQMEIVAITGVAGYVPGTGEERVLDPFYAFGLRPAAGDRKKVFYRVRLRPAAVGDGTEAWISFVDPTEANVIPTVETIRIKALCSNRRLPESLAPGDLRERTATTPGNVAIKDITKITPSVAPPLGGDLTWRMVSQMALNYLSVATAENLRAVLGLHDFRSLRDAGAARRLELRLAAIESIEVQPDEWLLQGHPVRGSAITIGLRDRQFGEAGEIQLFGSVLDVFFAMFSSLNAHTRLAIRGLDSGMEFRWKPRHGSQILH
jgi:type VI secretion system protein ImpG